MNIPYCLIFIIVQIKTHFLRPVLAAPEQLSSVENTLLEVCEREQYHLLESAISQDNLRLLVSLRPDQSIARVVKMIKGNTARRFALTFPQPCSQKLWSRGYYARTSGKVNVEKARAYVDSQVRHHGYRGEWTRALKYRNPAFTSPAFRLSHSFTQLNYHLVFATQNRIALFDEQIAPRLFETVIEAGTEHLFAVDRISVLPDHIHLLIEAKPEVCVEQCVMALMGNTRHWLAERYFGVLKQTGAWDVWQPSYYAGSVGEYSTAQVKKFLSCA